MVRFPNTIFQDDATMKLSLDRAGGLDVFLRGGGLKLLQTAQNSATFL